MPVLIPFDKCDIDIVLLVQHTDLGDLLITLSKLFAIAIHVRAPGLVVFGGFRVRLSGVKHYIPLTPCFKSATQNHCA
jgi:hypothetical protein